MENLCFPEFLTWFPTQAGGCPWQCGSLLVIAEGEEFLLEDLYFPVVLDLDFPPRQVDARGNAEVCSS